MKRIIDILQNIILIPAYLIIFAIVATVAFVLAALIVIVYPFASANKQRLASDKLRTAEKKLKLVIDRIDK